MTVRPLSLEAIKEVYSTLMQEDFCAEELKPLPVICSLYEDGIYFGMGLYDEERLLGYALFCRDPKSGYVLLDYYAIAKERRSGGFGTYFLQQLRQSLANADAILIEAEAVIAEQTEQQQEICRRRLSFYDRSGCVKIGATVMLHSVRLHVLMLSCSDNSDKGEAFKAMQSIYNTMLPDDRDITVSLD